MVIDRKKGQCFIIGVAVPGDSGVGEKEREKIENNQDLTREVAKLCNIKTTAVPIVVGVLGLVTENLTKHLAYRSDHQNRAPSKGSSPWYSAPPIKSS